MAARRRRRGGSRSPWALAGGAALLVVDLVLRDQAPPTGDQEIYERIAQSPIEPAHTFPFAFRLLTPVLAAALPFDTTPAFGFLCIVGSGAAAGVLFLVLEQLAAPRSVSVPLAILFALSPPLVVAAVRDGRVPDPLTALVMCAGALAIVRRRPVWLGAVLLAGVANHEAALWLVPWAYAAWARRLLDRRALAEVALCAAPALAAWAALRLSIPTVGREQVRGYGSLIGGRLDVLEAAAQEPVQLLRRVALVYGPLWLLLPLALRDSAFARRAAILALPVALTMTFGLDWQRFVFFAAPAVYGAAACVLTERPRLRAPTIVLLGATFLVYVVYLQASGIEANILDAAPPTYPVR